jgi:hypothetical protein
MSCRLVKYCNAECQKKHWPTHKKKCKQRAAEIHDEALFKDPPPKEDCPICFLPMPGKLLSCISLPPATMLSVPIYDFAIANEEVAKEAMETHHPCCGKHICRGCMHSFGQSGNGDKCPFCNSDRRSKTDEDGAAELMKRVEVNDPGAMKMLAGCYYQGLNGFQQDHGKAIKLYTRAAELGCSEAHIYLGNIYHEWGDRKKTKSHLEAGAMAGHEVARCNLGVMEYHSGNMERAVKHWTIGASAGDCQSMHNLRALFEDGVVSRELINSTLEAYNNSCAEFRSEARDTFIHAKIGLM